MLQIYEFYKKWPQIFIFSYNINVSILRIYRQNEIYNFLLK